MTYRDTENHSGSMIGEVDVAKLWPHLTQVQRDNWYALALAELQETRELSYGDTLWGQLLQGLADKNAFDKNCDRKKVEWSVRKWRD